MSGLTGVAARSGMPGLGFFSLARRLGREGTDEAIWRRERELLRAVWALEYGHGSDQVAASPVFAVGTLAGALRERRAPALAPC